MCTNAMGESENGDDNGVVGGNNGSKNENSAEMKEYVDPLEREHPAVGAFLLCDLCFHSADPAYSPFLMHFSHDFTMLNR